jgi:hypothetical protein
VLCTFATRVQYYSRATRDALQRAFEQLVDDPRDAAVTMPASRTFFDHIFFELHRVRDMPATRGGEGSPGGHSLRLTRRSRAKVENPTQTFRSALTLALPIMEGYELGVVLGALERLREREDMSQTHVHVR